MPGQPETAVPDGTASLSLPEVAGQVLQGLPLGVLVFDRELRVVYRNELARRMFTSVATVPELLIAGVVEGSGRDWAAELARVLETRTPLRQDHVVFVAGNTELLLNLVCTPLTDRSGGEVTGGILAIEDVTNRAGLERRLAVSERLAPVGKLAARVAHELNNPLDGILRYINLSIRLLDASSSGKVVGYLEESRQGLMRMAQIISELLEFSRSSSAHFEEMNISGTVEEAVRTMQDNAQRAGVMIATFLREEGMPVLRGGMLFQVCCNLIKNAIDAMPDGGRLSITASVVDRQVVLRFEDTGVGLPDDIDRIFEPFFTTKKAGQGTGLGLAICKDYIERLHGRIVAQRGEPHGAVFTIYVPLASCAPDSYRNQDR